MNVTVTRKAHEAEVPSIAGIGGYLLQDAVTVITTHTGAEIIVVGSRSTMRGVDVSSDAPAGTHDTIVAYWQTQAERWAASAARLERDDVGDMTQIASFASQSKSVKVTGLSAPVVFAGGVVDAPGFTTETFAAGVEKATRLGTLHMTPTGHGSVLVMSAHSSARYVVTRSSCTCRGHMGHGHCYHRAAALVCSDVFGLDLAHDYVLGFDPTGRPVTAADRAAQLQEVA